MFFLVIVNGKPRSGKNTFVQFVRDVISERWQYEFPTEERSTIECIVEMLHEKGVNTSRKTEKDRKLLAELGYSLEEHSDFRTNDVINDYHRYVYDVNKYRNEIVPVAYFTYTREVDLIEKMKRNKIFSGQVNKTLFESRFVPITVFIENPFVEYITSNSADAGVTQEYNYDYRIVNDHGISELKEKAEKFVDYLEGLINES